ncbi:MAG: hypothetical protein FWE88_08895, partial [Phycisphaerae bacterium]|nr:hypothetical protein [Phycisphaerae bacterium]
TVDVAVNATSNVAVASPSATLTGTADFRGIGADTTAQTAHVSPTQWADGGDNRPVAIVATFSGSGWPIVLIVVVMGLVLVFYSSYTEQKKKLTEEELHSEKLERNGQSVASAIKDMGPSPARDLLLTLIKQRIPDQSLWNDVVGTYDVSPQSKTQPNAA